MLKKLLILPAMLLATTGRSCVTCNRQVRDAIFASTFYPNLLSMLSAFIVIAVIVAVLSRLATRRHLHLQRHNPDGTYLSPVPLSTAAMVLGIGVGGFIDGILLHQLLQWHEMLTAKIAPDTVVAKSVNMFWDGIFHAFTLLTTILGIYLLWRISGQSGINRSGYLLSGGMLAGWGLFNLVEGLIDHQILNLHNVRELSPHQAAWNWGFLVLGLLQLIGGWLMIRCHGKHRAGAQAGVE